MVDRVLPDQSLEGVQVDSAPVQTVSSASLSMATEPQVAVEAGGVFR
jgi:hypothetical protein